MSISKIPFRLLIIGPIALSRTLKRSTDDITKGDV